MSGTRHLTPAQRERRAIAAAALVRRVVEEVCNHGNLALLGELLAPPACAVSIDRGPEAATRVAPATPVWERLRDQLAAFRAAVPDACWTIVEQVSEGETVVTRLSVRGSFSGPLVRLAPPGRPATLTGVVISRFAAGRLVDLWLQADLLGLLEQLSVMPPLDLAQTVTVAQVLRAGRLLAESRAPPASAGRSREQGAGAFCAPRRPAGRERRISRDLATNICRGDLCMRNPITRALHIRHAVALVLSLAALAVSAAPPASRAASGASDWPMFGQNLSNTASAPFTNIGPYNAGALRQKWAFTTGGDVSARAAVVKKVAYFPDWSGTVYAVKAGNGKLIWSKNILADYFQGTVAGHSGVTKVVSRTSPFVDIASRTMYIGTQTGAYLLAINIDDGSLKWKTQLDTHPLAIATESPVVYRGVIYMGVASLEEGAAANPSYPCCSFQGSMLAVNAASGAVIWKTYTTSGTSLPADPALGYTGNSVWASSAVVDPELNQVYYTTGNNYQDPDRLSRRVAARLPLAQRPRRLRAGRGHVHGGGQVVAAAVEWRRLERGLHLREHPRGSQLPGIGGPGLRLRLGRESDHLPDAGRAADDPRGRAEERRVLGVRPGHGPPPMGHPGRTRFQPGRPRVGLGQRWTSDLRGHRQPQPFPLRAAFHAPGGDGRLLGCSGSGHRGYPVAGTGSQRSHRPGADDGGERGGLRTLDGRVRQQPEHVRPERVQRQAAVELRFGRVGRGGRGRRQEHGVLGLGLLQSPGPRLRRQ